MIEQGCGQGFPVPETDSSVAAEDSGDGGLKIFVNSGEFVFDVLALHHESRGSPAAGSCDGIVDGLDVGAFP